MTDEQQHIFEDIHQNEEEEEAGSQEQSGSSSRLAQEETAGIPEEAENSKTMMMMMDSSSSEKDEEKRTEEEDDGGGSQIVATIDDDNEEKPIMSIWVWCKVLECISRLEMAERVSLTCRWIKKLCWPRLHGDKVTPRVVKADFHFREGSDEHGRPTATLSIWKEGTWTPMPITPPPPYIQALRSIRIYFLDRVVLDFLRDSSLIKVCLTLAGRCSLHNVQSLLAALNGCPITRLEARTSLPSFSIAELRQHSPPGLLETIPVIHVRLNHKEDCLVMNELILEKMESGQPFRYRMEYMPAGHHPIPIEAIKEAFRTATQRQSFCITISMSGGREEWEVFELVNEETEEVLALERHLGYRHYEMYRCPRGEVQQWQWQLQVRLFGIHRLLGIHRIPGSGKDQLEMELTGERNGATYIDYSML